MREQTTTIKIPELSLVVLIGASGSGKSSFARVDYRNSGHEESDYSGKAGHYEN